MYIYIFILDLAAGFNALGRVNYKTRWETFKFVQVWWYYWENWQHDENRQFFFSTKEADVTTKLSVTNAQYAPTLEINEKKWKKTPPAKHMTRKCFLYYWPFVKGFPTQTDSNEELWFLPEEAVKQIMFFSVIWDDMALVCNGAQDIHCTL